MESNNTNQTERKNYQTPELIDLSIVSTAIGNNSSCGGGSSGGQR